MADEWVNAMLGVNYDDNYDTVMNHVIDHINYSSADGSGRAASYENDYGNERVNDGGDDGDDSSGTDDDSDENEDSTSTNNEDESFWQREFDNEKLLLCIVFALHMYYVTYVHKEPCIVSYNTGMRWLTEVIQGH